MQNGSKTVTVTVIQCDLTNEESNMINKNVRFKAEGGSMWLKAKIIKVVFEKDGYILRCGGIEFFCKKENVKGLPIA